MRRTKEQAAETRDAVIAAAREVFAEKGYADASVAEIARRAGQTHGALYHHFASKEDLFRAVYELVVSSLDLAVRSAARRAPDLWTAFVAGCRAVLEAMAQPEYQQIALADAPAVIGMADWRRLDSAVGMGTMIGGLLALQQGGHLPPGPVEPLAALLFGGLTEAGSRIALGDPAITVDSTMDALVAVIESLNATRSLTPVAAG